MLRILRNLRRSLLSDSRVRGYVLYATGEIVLVVVGILIALQVNNWNELRSDRTRLDTLLRNVQSDLASDIEQADGGLPQGRRLTAQVDSLLGGQLGRADYEDPERRDLFWVGLQYRPFAQRRIAYERLASFEGVAPPEYLPVLDVLDQLYVQESDLLNSRTAIGIGQVEARHAWLELNAPWYWKLRERTFDEEMLEWYLTSDEHRNFIVRFRADQIFRQGSYVDRYRELAITAYLAIADFLGEPIGADAIPKDLILSNPEQAAEWAGSWVREDRSSEAGARQTPIEIRAGVLHVQGTATRQLADSVFEPVMTNGDRTLTFTRASDGKWRAVFREGENEPEVMVRVEGRRE